MVLIGKLQLIISLNDLLVTNKQSVDKIFCVYIPSDLKTNVEQNYTT